MRVLLTRKPTQLVPHAATRELTWNVINGVKNVGLQPPSVERSDTRLLNGSAC